MRSGTAALNRRATGFAGNECETTRWIFAASLGAAMQRNGRCAFRMPVIILRSCSIAELGRRLVTLSLRRPRPGRCSLRLRELRVEPDCFAVARKTSSVKR
jgi:hypothetical protein